MMNNELVQKESSKLASRVLRRSSGSLSEAVTLAYRTTLGRKPSNMELSQALTYINGNPAKVKEFTWMLFNLDEFMYVR